MSITAEKTFASDSFIASIEGFSEGLCKELRVLSSSVFISESVLPKVASEYESWLSRHNLSLKSDDKLNRRIFGIDNPPLYYLSEGQGCISGYVSNYNESNESKVNSITLIPKTASSAISAFDYLHPKDPLLNNNNLIRLRQNPSTGTNIEFKASSLPFVAKESIARKIVNLLRSSSFYQERHPEIYLSLREAFHLLSKILIDSKAISNKKIYFVPEAVLDRLNKSEVSIRISANLLLIFEGDVNLIDAYEMRGRNFRELIKSEFSHLKNDKKVLQIETIELISDPLEGKQSAYPARVKIKGKPFAIEQRAIFDLIESVPRSPWMKKKLPSLFSLRHVLEAIGFALKYADWVNLSSLGNSENSESKSRGSYELKYIPWTFQTGRKVKLPITRANKPNPRTKQQQRSKPHTKDQYRSGKSTRIDTTPTLECGTIVRFSESGARDFRFDNKLSDRKPPSHLKSGKMK